jgi:hypothetical protein
MALNRWSNILRWVTEDVTAKIKQDKKNIFAITDTKNKELEILLAQKKFADESHARFSRQLERLNDRATNATKFIYVEEKFATENCNADSFRDCDAAHCWQHKHDGKMTYSAIIKKEIEDSQERQKAQEQILRVEESIAQITREMQQVNDKIAQYKNSEEYKNLIKIATEAQEKLSHLRNINHAMGLAQNEMSFEHMKNMCEEWQRVSALEPYPYRELVEAKIIRILENLAFYYHCYDNATENQQRENIRSLVMSLPITEELRTRFYNDIENDAKKRYNYAAPIRKVTLASRKEVVFKPIDCSMINEAAEAGEDRGRTIKPSAKEDLETKSDCNIDPVAEKEASFTKNMVTSTTAKVLAELPSTATKEPQPEISAENIAAAREMARREFLPAPRYVSLSAYPEGEPVVNEEPAPYLTSAPGTQYAIRQPENTSPLLFQQTTPALDARTVEFPTVPGTIEFPPVPQPPRPKEPARSMPLP